MNIIAVDDEYHALEVLGDAIKEALPDSRVFTFDDPEDALRFSSENPVDVAFLDIEMREMTGLQLAEKMKDLWERTNIIFVTGYKEYALEAMALHASGYLTKPVAAADIIGEIENLRHPVKAADSGVYIQCFGNFEVFVDGQPVYFARVKAKEVLAYLVDRHGTNVSKKEIAAILWEDEPYDRNQQKRLDNIIAEMIRALKEVDAENIILKKNGFYAINVPLITCDFYLYEAGDASAMNRYHGQYMANYSWAEFTAGRLIKNFIE